MMSTLDGAVAQGWGALFKEGYATDSTSAVAVTIALFVAPARPPVFEDLAAAATQPRDLSRPDGCASNHSHGQNNRPMPRCLDWETAVNIPWGIILLLGGGFAIADAFDASGLNTWLGCRESNVCLLLAVFAAVQQLPLS